MKIQPKTPKAPKVAILQIPAHEYAQMSPQQQMLLVSQQMLGFIASEGYREMDGFTVRLVRLDRDPPTYIDIVTIGEPAPLEGEQKKTLIMPERKIIKPGH